MKINLPIGLTFFRIFLIPFFILAFYLPFKFSAFITALIFLIASATDFLDGFLARLLNQTTKFGAFLDPVADKIMVAIASILITEYYDVWWITLPVVVLISREILISALREWMAELGKRGIIKVSYWGKIKTIAQMTALTLLLWHPSQLITNIGMLCLYIATLLTLWSMYQYLSASRHDLLNDNP